MSNGLVQFSQILGQRGALDAIASAWRSERLAHGLIFAGPVGVGKATTARALAALFLCEKPKDISACGKCESCRAMSADVHPDYHVVHRKLVRLIKTDSKARDLAADVIREYLLEKAANKSVHGTGKVFIVEEAELMSAAAQNTLLKTLEEPAGRTLIVLLTPDPQSLLPTIRSRARLIQFAPLPPATVENELQERNFSKTQAHRRAEIAEGSLGLAIRWIEDGVVERADELAQRLDKLIAGKPVPDLRDWLKGAFEAYSTRQEELDKNVSIDQSKREGLVLYFTLAAQHIRGKLRETRDPDDLERLCRAIDALGSAEGYVESNVNLGLVIQQLAVALDGAMRPHATA